MCKKTQLEKYWFSCFFHEYAFFDKNNEDIALNVLYVSTNAKQVRQE